MSVLDDVQSVYRRIREAQQRVTDLAVATATLVAAAETELTQARADLDALAATFGYTVPARQQAENPPDWQSRDQGTASHNVN